jgi:hypothetical protein
MKFDAQTMDGDGLQLVHDTKVIGSGLALLLSIFIVFNAAHAQQLYKYRGADGEWIYSDRPPEDGEVVERRVLKSTRSKPEFTITQQIIGRVVRLTAGNRFCAPVEITLDIKEIDGLEYPNPEQTYRRMLAPRSETALLSLNSLENNNVPNVEYDFKYLPGDPSAEHRPTDC